MDRDYETGAVNFISGLVLGTLLGATAALLTAPRSGRGTRRRIRRVAVDARDSAQDHLEDLREEMKGRVDDAIQGARRRLS